MILISPRGMFRLTCWIVLLSLGGCAGTPRATALLDTACAAARDAPEPDTEAERQARDAILVACVARKAARLIAPDAGVP